MPSVEAVLFDYGLVLTGPADPGAWERLKGVLQADEASFHKAYWDHRQAYDRGDLTAEAYWRRVAGDLGKSLDEVGLGKLLDADLDLWTVPNHAMIDWAARLQRADVKTGILSNIGDAMETGVMARCAWLSGFTSRTFSHRLNLAKPEAAIYRAAAEGLGVAVGEVLFIDDREDNIAAARAVGMQAVQYKEQGAFVREMTDAGFGSLLNL